MVLLVCTLLAIGAILYVFWVKPEPQVAPSPAAREAAFLNERKEVLYENLRDLHLEYRMGKLSDRDYQQLKEHYQQQLAALLHDLEQVGAQLPATPTRAGLCPQCGQQNPAANRFCGTCGARLELPSA